MARRSRDTEPEFPIGIDDSFEALVGLEPGELDPYLAVTGPLPRFPPTDLMPERREPTREPRPAAPIPEGSIWDGRYRIERSLGEGGMGNVLLASDLAKEERPIALKVLQPCYREVATAYFMREYAIQRVLRHPSIARALDLGFDSQDGEEVPYFAMPFVPGVPLAALMARPNPLGTIWRWTIEILEALDAMHRAGYLHRDIKPGNVLVDPRSDESPSARLIDFGIATSLASEPEEFFIGTPEFSAPERIHCAPFDVRSDLYSVGLLLFELIEGTPPWHGTEPGELLELRMSTPARPILHPDCPPAVKQLVAELLDVDPQRRPPSAAHVIARLRSAIGMPGSLESTRAFEMRLSGLTIPSESYRRALEAEGELIAIEVPDGHPASELLDEIGDRAALGGVRVVRVKLKGEPGPPMHELEGALEVFRRLRMREGGDLAQSFRGLAGAATMLTRLHRKTMLVIEGLDRADEATLMVLGHAFMGAHNSFLTVVASVASDRAPRARAALGQLLREDFVKRVALQPLSVGETGALVSQALGPGLLDPEVIEALHDEAGGRPERVLELLAEAYRRGILIRQPEGYVWLESAPEDAKVGEVDRTGLLVVDLERDIAERLSLLQAPYPAEAVERYLGDPVTYRRLLASGVLMLTAGDWVVCVQRDACSWRYAALPPARRYELHAALAEALAALPPHLGPASLVADQLALTERPGRAIPFLVRAAQDARAERQDGRASTLVQRAIDLAREDEADDTNLGEWKLLAYGAALDLARELGHDEAIVKAADQLLTAAVEHAHLPSIERALAAEIDQAEAVWDVARAVSSVDKLLLFQKSCGAPEATSLHAWARALEAALAGEVAEVFRWTSRGLGVGTTVAAASEPTGSRPSIARWARVKLLALQAEVAVRAGLAVLAPKALDAFERAAGIEDPWIKGLAHGLRVRATLLRSAWLRRTGALSQARELLEPFLEPSDVRAPNAGAAALVRSSRGPRSRGPSSMGAAQVGGSTGHPGSRFGLTRVVRRAHIDLELAEADLALGRCQEALAHGKKALERARKERHAVVAFAAEGLLADAWTRVGEPDKQLARLDRVVHVPPPQALPQIVVDVKLRWLVSRLAAIELGQVEVGETVSEEANAIAGDADKVAREAARMKDLAATARAAFIAAQAALRARRPVEALRQAEWVRELAKREPVGGPPQHAVEWLLASVHYQMKWFKSANALSQRAMESLRTVAQSGFDGADRDRWLRAGSNSLIGLLR